MSEVIKNPKFVKKYVENPDNCPYCGSSNIIGDMFEASYNQAWRPVTCNNCGQEWREIFTITDIEEI